MLRRAWSRTLALFFRNAPSLVLPNLQASLALGLMVAAYYAALFFRAPSQVFVLLKSAAALLCWMGFSWLAFAARQAFEDPQFKPGLGSLRRHLALRGRERALSFLAAAAAAFWAGFALSFYRAAAQGTWIAAAVLAAGVLAAFIGLSALALNFGLSSRIQAQAVPEWKASFLMAAAFAPQCLGALAALAFLSGGTAMLAGNGSFLARLLWAPALAAPVFSAALAAAFLVALSDEFLAKSHGIEPPAFEPFEFRELFRPWR